MTIKTQTKEFQYSWGEVSHTCAAVDFGQGVYNLVLLDTTETVFSHALAEWLKRNPLMHVISTMQINDPRIKPTLLVIVKR